MVQEIRSLQKLAIFFQGLTLGAEGGGLVRGTLRYVCMYVWMDGWMYGCMDM